MTKKYHSPFVKTNQPKTRYYFVSFMFTNDSGTGFGNQFIKASPYLDIRDAEKQIQEANNHQKAIIIAINEIHKSQFVEQWTDK